MKVGFIGKRSSGKTTLFEAVSALDLTQHAASLVNIAKVKVKDPSIDKLSEIFKPKKTTYAEVDVIDYNRSMDASDSMLGSAGLVSKYRELDALVIVFGVLDDISTIKNELTEIRSELNLLDAVILDAKIERMKKGAHDKHELSVYEDILAKIESNTVIDRKSIDKDQNRWLSAFQLFALKPIMIAVNVTEDILSSGKAKGLSLEGVPHMVLSAEIEKELSSMSGQERDAFLKEYGLDEPLSERFIRLVYETMDLISFYTVGEDEVRAWTINKGSTALVAAGKIHSDIERGFIRASTVHYDEFMKYGDEHKAKAAGVVRSEGKEYIVQHGDIIHFKFNV